jgi:hypothetical protein
MTSCVRPATDPCRRGGAPAHTGSHRFRPLSAAVCLVLIAALPACRSPSIAQPTTSSQPTHTLPTPTALPPSSTPPPRTPPALPAAYRSPFLDAADSPHVYIDDACRFVRDKWSTDKARRDRGAGDHAEFHHQAPFESTDAIGSGLRR